MSESGCLFEGIGYLVGGIVDALMPEEFFAILVRIGLALATVGGLVALGCGLWCRWLQPAAPGEVVTYLLWGSLGVGAFGLLMAGYGWLRSR